MHEYVKVKRLSVQLPPNCIVEDYAVDIQPDLLEHCIVIACFLLLLQVSLKLTGFSPKTVCNSVNIFKKFISLSKYFSLSNLE